MHGGTPVDERVGSLVKEIGEDLRTELRTALETLRGAGNVPGTLTSLSRLLERRGGLLERIATAHQHTLRGFNLDKQIEELAARGIIPGEIASDLHWVRIRANRARHGSEEATLTGDDGETALGRVLRVLEWFFAEAGSGPRLPALYGDRRQVVLGQMVAACRTLLRGQVQAVGHEKYRRELNVRRDVEQRIEEFLGFDASFRKRAQVIVQALQAMATRYQLREAPVALVRADELIRDSDSTQELLAGLRAVEEAFGFNEAEQVAGLIDAVIWERSEAAASAQTARILRLLHELPSTDPAALPTFNTNLRELRGQTPFSGRLDPDKPLYKDVLAVLPSSWGADRKLVLANDLIREFRQLAGRLGARCLALVARAGQGKTNVMCRLAERLASDHPVLLLSGQLELAGGSDLKSHVQQQLKSTCAADYAEWIGGVSADCKASNRWLYVLIDGINESGQLVRMVRQVGDLLAQLTDRRVKLIVSCRDVFWDLFRTRLSPYLFDGQSLNLGEFSEAEQAEALGLYFRHFGVQCLPDAEARMALRNPLLLRFFGEASRGKQLGVVSDLRLLSVFDLYVRRMTGDIAERLGLLNSDPVLSLLVRLGKVMWQRQHAVIPLAELGIGGDEATCPTSPYSLVRAENVIVEEVRHSHGTEKFVRFVYDEFMEYVIARSWLDDVTRSPDSSAAVRPLLAGVVDAMSHFQPAFGALIFLDRMLAKSGALVNRLIALVAATEGELLATRQVAMLLAFDNASVREANEELFQALEQFERLARDDLKERLGVIILRFLEVHAGHPALQGLAGRLLEVDRDAASPQPAARPTPNQAAACGGEERKKPGAKPGEEPAAPKLTTPSLPPARYHYGEQTRLTAIALLAAAGGEAAFPLVEEGIRRLGRMQRKALSNPLCTACRPCNPWTYGESQRVGQTFTMQLYGALQALAALDYAEDRLVCHMIPKYRDAGRAEYRIYCAWLLRERYGGEPARTLARLLLDADTRVHRFTFQLFKKRQIEPELVERLLEAASPVGVEHPWHLRHVVSLLGQPGRFRGDAARYTAPIVTALQRLADHPRPLIRLECYRGLWAFGGHVDPVWLQERLARDSDPRVRGLRPGSRLPRPPD
jgi:hypothetical protein